MLTGQGRVRKGPSPRADKAATADNGLGRERARRSSYVRYLRFSIKDPVHLAYGSRGFDGVRITPIIA